MKGMAITIVLLMSCGVTACDAQEPTPTILMHAAHCLAVKDFLPRPNARGLTLSYFLDEHSYPGEKVIYVVAFGDPHASNGDVFAVFLSTKSGQEDFDIQNNASFSLSKAEPLGVSFKNPPLGGDWTQEHLASAIQTIEKQPRFTVFTKDLLATVDVACESYSDSQPRK